MTTSTGQRAKLSRPLDFLVVSDHSEMFGLMPQLMKGDPAILAAETGRKWFDGIRRGGDVMFKTVWEIIKTLSEAKPPTNTIGAPELIAVWKAPDFDAKERAFYCARVIEIPTPRWTAYDAKRFGIETAKEVPTTTTERAYTSPIWYTPAK